MATGQYLSEVAVRLVERGHQVTVLTSRRAYDDPRTLFPRHETWRGIAIHRVGSTGWGKGAKWKRAADFASFLASCCGRLAFLPRPDAVVALTSPPLISFIGAWLARWRRARFLYWVMDLNPDEAIAAGWLRPNSFLARLLERGSRFSLRQAVKIIALDRFMVERISAKGVASAKIAVIPPWSQDDDVRFDWAGRERFRRAHGLNNRFVVMHAGNHSPCHPLDTLLEAAFRLRDDTDIAFCFVGGGSRFASVQQFADQHRLRNMVCLPYQPLDELAGTLSAADMHVVVMGDAFVGVVHPCKVYNILRVGTPILYIGPPRSHVSEIVAELPGRHLYRSVQHGDVDGVMEHIRRVRVLGGERQAERVQTTSQRYSKEALLARLIAEVEGQSATG